MIGNPLFSANCLTSEIDDTGPSVPGITGNPALVACVLAFTLSPNTFKCSLVGPIKIIPSSSQRCEEEGIIFIGPDRKSTRLNSSHVASSYPVFCLQKKI